MVVVGCVLSGDSSGGCVGGRQVKGASGTVPKAAGVTGSVGDVIAPLGPRLGCFGVTLSLVKVQRPTLEETILGPPHMSVRFVHVGWNFGPDNVRMCFRPAFAGRLTPSAADDADGL